MFTADPQIEPPVHFQNSIQQPFVFLNQLSQGLSLGRRGLALQDTPQYLPLLRGKLETLPIGDSELFSQVYASEVQKISARVLLYNVEKMFASFSE